MLNLWCDFSSRQDRLSETEIRNEVITRAASLLHIFVSLVENDSHNGQIIAIIFLLPYTNKHISRHLIERVSHDCTIKSEHSRDTR